MYQLFKLVFSTVYIVFLLTVLNQAAVVFAELGLELQVGFIRKYDYLSLGGHPIPDPQVKFVLAKLRLRINRNLPHPRSSK